MIVHGTKEAFFEMITERGVYKKLGVDKSTVSTWKLALRGSIDRQAPSLDKMEEMLSKYGAVVVSEKIWQIPEKKQK